VVVVVVVVVVVFVVVVVLDVAGRWFRGDRRRR